MSKRTKPKPVNLAERARSLGIGPRKLAELADLSHTTVWRALKSNTLPPRNSAAFKLRRALRLDEVAHAG